MQEMVTVIPIISVRECAESPCDGLECRFPTGAVAPPLVCGFGAAFEATYGPALGGVGAPEGIGLLVTATPEDERASDPPSGNDEIGLGEVLPSEIVSLPVAELEDVCVVAVEVGSDADSGAVVLTVDEVVHFRRP